MNELDLVRDFRGAVPPPDDATRAAVRARALALAAAPSAAAAPAQRRRRGRWLVRGAVAMAAAAAVLAYLLAAPFEGEEPGILDRARAAVGTGPVLHLVLREEWGGTLIDLETGRPLKRLHGEREVWFDPTRGLHEISRFGGVVQNETVYPPGRLARHLEKTYAGLADGYRKALASGEARVLGSGVVDGIPVYWIRVDAEWLPDVADNRLHEWAHDVAVSRETYEPVYFRETRDGKPGPDTGARVLRMDSLPAGAGDFDAKPSALDGMVAVRGVEEQIGLESAATVLGRPALWLGREFRGLPLARLSRLELASRPRDGSDWDRVSGVTLFYGSLRQAPGRDEQYPDYEQPYVWIQELSRYHHALPGGPYVPPEGTAVVYGNVARARKSGLVISVTGSDAALVTGAARALEEIPATG